MTEAAYVLLRAAVWITIGVLSLALLRPRVMAFHPGRQRAYANALIKARMVQSAAPVACHWRTQPLLIERIAMLKQGKHGGLARMSGQMLLAGLCIGVAGIAWASQTAVATQETVHGVIDKDAKPLQTAAPDYPKAAFDAGIAGRVVLDVEVGADGVVSNVGVVSSTPPGVFDGAAMRAAWQWTFEPAVKQGKPAVTRLQMPVTFALDSKAAAR